MSALTAAQSQLEATLIFACSQCNCVAHRLVRAELVLKPAHAPAVYEDVKNDHEDDFDPVIQVFPTIHDRKWLGGATVYHCLSKEDVLRRVADFLAINCHCDGHEQVRHRWARGDQDVFAACLLFDQMIIENLIQDHTDKRII